MIQKLQSLKFEKMGQILCVKKVPFRKSGHKYFNNWVICSGLDNDNVIKSENN